MSSGVSVDELVLVRRLINQFGFAVDTPDFEVLASCWAPNATFRVGFPGAYSKLLQGIGEIEGHIRSLHSTFATHRHVITNHRYTIEGSTGFGQSAFTAYHWSQGKPTMKVGGSWQDEIVKIDGSWRFQHRQGKVDWRQGAEGQYARMAERPST